MALYQSKTRRHMMNNIIEQEADLPIHPKLHNDKYSDLLIYNAKICVSFIEKTFSTINGYIRIHCMYKGVGYQ